MKKTFRNIKIDTKNTGLNRFYETDYELMPNKYHSLNNEIKRKLYNKRSQSYRKRYYIKVPVFSQYSKILPSSFQNVHTFEIKTPRDNESNWNQLREEAEQNLDNRLRAMREYLSESWKHLFQHNDNSGDHCLKDFIEYKTESIRERFEAYCKYDYYDFDLSVSDYINDDYCDHTQYQHLEFTSQWNKWIAGFIEKFEDVILAKSILQVVLHRLNFLLNTVKKLLRNLRQLFAKQHSFHFKNLDDYHDYSFNLSF